MELTGQIERVTYTSEETGYTVARVKVYGQRDLVTVVGNIMSPTPGEILTMAGEWTHHPSYGEQFNIKSYKTKVPATVYGIQKYLGSGLIKGLGPKMAARIVKKFGKETLDIIEHQAERLSSVNGIGKKRISMIRKAWQDQKEIRDVMLFLQSHGVSSAYATKIFKAYGDRSIAVVRDNPFRLAMDIFGIGFVVADGIAEKLGVPKDSPARAQAGIIYVLHKLSDEGHVYFPYENLIQKCNDILEVNQDVIVSAISELSVSRKIVIEDLNTSDQDSRENHKAVFLAKYHLCETRAAEKLKQLKHAPRTTPPMDVEKALKWVQKEISIDLAASQFEAIRSALTSKVMVITGGPGTGKTTIINALLKILLKRRFRTLLAAPTGRAAKRMQETSGHTSKTIHRLLEYSMQNGGFQKNEENPLECDLLIIDEASMIDSLLMHHLLKAIPLNAALILVGDVNQLPSVGAGNVLNDIIGAGTFPVITLTEIFRQARESKIIMSAHAINNGASPSLDSPGTYDKNNDFYFIEQEDPEKVVNMIHELVTERIPRRFNLDPLRDIQVLTPMHKGIVGATNLNQTLQAALTPENTGVSRGNVTFRVGDKVMQIKNNYDKVVFNGDIGRVVGISPVDHQVIIAFEGQEIPYDFSDLDEIVLAYAISVHKSQGSEYPAVVMPVLTQHYMLLQRNLIYTAVTRGRRLVVLIGTRKALAIGINNNKTRKRFTRLKDRLSS
jgi:exodeoxyribonuclease V alpha subunit